MKFKEFVFIFEDIWNNAEPHTERLDRHLEQAEEIMKTTVLDFTGELAKTIDTML